MIARRHDCGSRLNRACGVRLGSSPRVKGKRVNDTSPMPALRDDHQAYLAPDDTAPATRRWRLSLLPSDPAASQQDFAGDGGGLREQEFLRLWPDEDAQTAGGTSRWSWLFSLRALQGAVIANGAALIALALLMAAPNTGSKTGLMTSAIALGLGLMFAAVSAVASLDFRGAQMRLARIAAPLAGAVSYGALAAAFALI